MAGVERSKLKKEINEILKNADLTQTSAKKVRQQLEIKLNCDLTERKKEIDSLVMDFVNSKEQSEDSDEDDIEKKESDSEDNLPKRRSTLVRKAQKQKKKPKTTGVVKRKGTGFTRPYTLSPELAALMGADALPKHEVVKKIWAIIKERNLADPKNKSYALCDNDLFKVIGVKRFHSFGMLKYLKHHFLN